MIDSAQARQLSIEGQAKSEEKTFSAINGAASMGMTKTVLFLGISEEFKQKLMLSGYSLSIIPDINGIEFYKISW